MHCRKMEMVPGVPRHVLVSYISEPSIIARLKEYLMVNQSIISLCSIFFGTLCIFDMSLGVQLSVGS